MTVCIGALFKWNYGLLGAPEDWGTVILAVSDRMITAGDMEYEPFQQKVADLAPNVIVLIAGDYTIHSQAIKVVQAQLRGRAQVSVHDASVMYGSAIQAIHRKAAEDLYLAPLGLNTDSFLAQQKEMAAHFVETLTQQLQNYAGPDVEGLVLGFSENRPHLYEINRYGSVGCYDDVGFAAIGIGATHARSTMMQAGYINNWNFGSALSVAFAAKKAAETAPGVGKTTDVTIQFRDRREPLRSDIAAKLEAIYSDYSDQRRVAVLDAIRKLNEAFSAPNPNLPAQPALEVQSAGKVVLEGEDMPGQTVAEEDENATEARKPEG